MASLKLEIVQEPPFSSVEEEALLNLLRTSDAVHRAFQRKTRDWGVTSTQYNVLRILRGAQPQGLEHVGRFPHLFAELIRRGFSDQG